MPLTRKQFLDIAGPGALGAFAYSTLASPIDAEARHADDGGVALEANEQRFSYMASAVALGGRMEIPFADLLDAQAATALPPMGGRGVAKVENYRYGQVERGSYLHIVSLDSAHSEVFGNKDEKTGEIVTLTTVTLKGLNVGNRITADKIVARLTSVRKPGTSEPPFYHRESTIEKLIVDKQVVELVPDEDLNNCPTFASAAEHYQKARPEILRRRRYQHVPRKNSEPYPDVMLLTSVFKQPPGFPVCPDALPGQCCIRAGNWSVTLGDLEITPESRRLTMVRVKMVPNQRGTIEAASVIGDGRDP